MGGGNDGIVRVDFEGSRKERREGRQEGRKVWVGTLGKGAGYTQA
jgi:hypothetical protein